MIKIVEYKPCYYEEVLKWFDKRNLNFVVSKDVSDVGTYIALHNDDPIAFGWIGITNTFVSLLTHLISNPESSMIVSGRAVKSLLAHMDNVAKLSGCSVITSIYSSKSTGRLLKKFGYSEPQVHYISSRKTYLEA